VFSHIIENEVPNGVLKEKDEVEGDSKFKFED
jgi:hypothetical protein